MFPTKATLGRISMALAVVLVLTILAVALRVGERLVVIDANLYLQLVRLVVFLGGVSLVGLATAIAALDRFHLPLPVYYALWLHVLVSTGVVGYIVYRVSTPMHFLLMSWIKQLIP